jgi:hypothetical protein
MPQLPVAPAGGEVRQLGHLPTPFWGDRSQADDFIDALGTYFRANIGVPGFKSPIRKVAIALTLLEGDQVAGWKRDMGNWLDSLNVVTDNFPIVWDIFKDTFTTRFQDSLKPQNAQSELSKLKMDFPYIDQYMARFEDLARLASYTVGNSETINIFLRRLDPDVLKTILSSENVDTYDQIHQHAISATRSKQLIAAIQGRSAQSNNNAFQHFQGQRRPFRPFFQRGNQGNPQQQRRPQYNSWQSSRPLRTGAPTSSGQKPPSLSIRTTPTYSTGKNHKTSTTVRHAGMRYYKTTTSP